MTSARSSRGDESETAMPNPDPVEGDVSLLARMMDLGNDDQVLWNAQDLGPIVQHQLSASLEGDLADLGPGLHARLKELRTAGADPIVTFRDLLKHPEPPLELLELTKQFAKRCRSNPDGPLPDDVATVLYLAAIAAAMVRLGARITKLNNEGMQHGLRWALGQTWLDASLPDLLQHGYEAFGGDGSAAS